MLGELGELTTDPKSVFGAFDFLPSSISILGQRRRERGFQLCTPFFQDLLWFDYYSTLHLGAGSDAGRGDLGNFLMVGSLG